MDWMHDTQAATEPARDSAENQGHKGQDGTGRGACRGGVSRPIRPLLDPLGGLLIPLLDMGNLLICFFDRDAARTGKGFRGQRL